MKESKKPRINLLKFIEIDSDALIQTFTSEELEALVERARAYIPKRLKELEEEQRRSSFTEASTNISPPYIFVPSPPTAPLTPMSKAARSLKQIKESRCSKESFAEPSHKHETCYALRSRNRQPK